MNALKDALTCWSA